MLLYVWIVDETRVDVGDVK